MQEGHYQEPLGIAVALNELQNRPENGFDGLVKKTSGPGGRAGDHGRHNHVHDNSADCTAGGHNAEHRAQRVLRHNIHDQRADVY